MAKPLLTLIAGPSDITPIYLFMANSTITIAATFCVISIEAIFTHPYPTVTAANFHWLQACFTIMAAVGCF